MYLKTWISPVFSSSPGTRKERRVHHSDHAQLSFKSLRIEKILVNSKMRGFFSSFNMGKTKPYLKIKYQLKMQHLQSEDVAGIHVVSHRERRGLMQSHRVVQDFAQKHRGTWGVGWQRTKCRGIGQCRGQWRMWCEGMEPREMRKLEQRHEAA